MSSLVLRILSSVILQLELIHFSKESLTFSVQQDQAPIHALERKACPLIKSSLPSQNFDCNSILILHCCHEFLKQVEAIEVVQQEVYGEDWIRRGLPLAQNAVFYKFYAYVWFALFLMPLGQALSNSCHQSEHLCVCMAIEILPVLVCNFVSNVRVSVAQIVVNEMLVLHSRDDNTYETYQ